MRIQSALTAIFALSILAGFILLVVFPDGHYGLFTGVFLFLFSAIVGLVRFAFASTEMIERYINSPKHWRIIFTGTAVSLAWFAFGVIFAGAYSSSVKFGSLVCDSCGTPIAHFGELIYFSLISGTTTGYGDIAPTGSLARFVACMNIFSFWFMFIMGINMLNSLICDS